MPVTLWQSWTVHPSKSHLSRYPIACLQVGLREALAGRGQAKNQIEDLEQRLNRTQMTMALHICTIAR